MSSQQQTCTAPPGRLHSLLPPPFRCTGSREGLRATRVEASGELDLVTAPELEDALRQAATGGRLVVLDLHALVFIDSTGVHAIEDASLRARAHGGRLVVSRAPAHVARILDLTGVSRTVELLDVDRPAAGAMPDRVRLVR